MTKTIFIARLKTKINLLLLLSFTMAACDKIYDNDKIEPQPAVGQSYQNINCTDYAKWVYINLHNGDSITLSYEQATLPDAWDIALHRYDVKTNGGKAVETSYGSLDELKAAVDDGTMTLPADELWEPDVEDSIIVDMSHMMEGYLVRSASVINRVLCRWLDVDLSSMPPIYTPSDKVYLLLLRDGTVAAIRFTGFINQQLYSTKGYISFDYCYPLTIKQ